LIGNTITGSDIAVRESSGGWNAVCNTITNSGLALNFGSGNWHYNNFESNVMNVNHSYYDTTITYDFSMNYWGSTVTSTIEDSIWHIEDDNSLGRVEYNPYLTSGVLDCSDNDGDQVPNDYDDDDDNDGVIDIDDQCPFAYGSGLTGCPDDDNDGVLNSLDICPNTPLGQLVNTNGCSLSQMDADGDGVSDFLDQCPNTPLSVIVDSFGCEIDSDNDGVPDSLDLCPNEDATGFDTNGDGCIDDLDNDGIPDSLDQCPNEDATGFDVNGDGCIDDTDNDGVKDHVDLCPNEDATGFDIDGDGCIDDGDGDGVKDNIDQCPNTPAGAIVDSNGCNNAPICDITYYDGTNTLTVQRDMPTINGQVVDVDVIMPSGTYTFLLVCNDPEGQQITIDVSFDGGPVSTFTANPVSSSISVPLPDGMTLTKQVDYSWSDGVNSGSVVVDIEVTGDDSAVPMASVVPGFTSVLTILSILCACLFMRRQ
jgi:hypothetical protein